MTWDFDDPQANFLDVLELATESGPQLIKRGVQRVYVVSLEDWERMGRMGSTLPHRDLLRAARSPLSSPVDLP